MSLTCTRCQAAAADGSAFCALCGSPVAPRQPRMALVVPGRPEPEVTPAVAPSPAPAEAEPQAPFTPAPPPAYSGPAYSGPAYSGPAYSGPAHSGPAYSGPAYSGAVPPPPAPASWLVPPTTSAPHAPWVSANAPTAPNRAPLVVGAAAVAVLLVAVVAGASGGGHTIRGTATLYDDAFLSVDDGEYCTGAMAGLGYSDMSSGTPVVVRDGGGDLVGSTTLGSGEVSGDGCEFTFRVEVDDATRYEVEAGDRGSLYYSADELEERDWRIDLSLGDD